MHCSFCLCASVSNLDHENLFICQFTICEVHMHFEVTTARLDKCNLRANKVTWQKLLPDLALILFGRFGIDPWWEIWHWSLFGDLALILGPWWEIWHWDPSDIWQVTKRRKEKKKKKSLVLWCQGSFTILRCFFIISLARSRSLS